MILKLIYKILAFIFYHLRINLLYSFIIKEYIEYSLIDNKFIILKELNYRITYINNYGGKCAGYFYKIIKKDGFNKYIDVFDDGPTTVFLINKKHENIC